MRKAVLLLSVAAFVVWVLNMVWWRAAVNVERGVAVAAAAVARPRNAGPWGRLFYSLHSPMVWGAGVHPDSICQAEVERANLDGICPGEAKKIAGSAYFNPSVALVSFSSREADLYEVQKKVRVSNFETITPVLRTMMSNSDVIIDTLPLELDVRYIIRIHEKANLTVDFGKLTLSSTSIEVTNCRYVTLRGLHMKGSTAKYAAVIIRNSVNTALTESVIDNPARIGVSVEDSVNTVILSVKISSPKSAGIAILGNSTHTAVSDCVVVGGVGTSILDAGIISTNRVFYAEGFDGGNPPPAASRTRGGCLSPTGSYIVKNSVESGSSIGVFLENSIGSVLEQNTIRNCSKEGISLGGRVAFANVIIDNRVDSCGARWAQRNAGNLEKDVPDLRTDDNGLSIYKLPGLTMSKAYYNVVKNNVLRGNYGGGVKLLREGYYNYITGNEIAGNNVGASKVFQFPGVSLMSDPDGAGRQGCSLNVVSHNRVLGGHGVGTLLAKGSLCNIFYRNTVEFKFFALESSAPDQLNFEQSSIFHRLQGDGPDVLKAHLQQLPNWGV